MYTIIVVCVCVTNIYLYCRLDCGVAVINIMESMASGIPVLEHFEDDDMKEMRATIVSSLLNDEFHWSQQ